MLRMYDFSLKLSMTFLSRKEEDSNTSHFQSRRAFLAALLRSEASDSSFLEEKVGGSIPDCTADQT